MTRIRWIITDFISANQSHPCHLCSIKEISLYLLIRFKEMEKHIDGYLISTEKERFDWKVIHDFLANSYWAKNIPLETVKRSVEHSLAVGVYLEGRQVGFARAITDCATFAYVADVFIVEDQRGKGLSKMLMQFLLDHPDLQGLRRIMLATRDAHSLYAQFGFKPLEIPARWMDKHNPEVYNTVL
jgi:GNAT superfamily N-acetyltransferase